MACGSSDDTTVRGTGSGTTPAVMVAVATRSPEGTRFYVGAYPELPAEVDLAQMVEAPSGQNATAFNGAIYVEPLARIPRRPGRPRRNPSLQGH